MNLGGISADEAINATWNLSVMWNYVTLNNDEQIIVNDILKETGKEIGDVTSCYIQCKRNKEDTIKKLLDIKSE